MLPPLRQTDRTTLRRRRQRGSYDRALVHAVLDEALVCHVAWAHEGEPMVQPMAFARVGEKVYLHGSPNNRCLLALASGAPASVSVTLVDALVLAKTAGHHSLNYRAVVLCGAGARVTDPAEARAGLEAVVEKMLPGRGAHAHGVTDDDLRTTLVVSLPIDEGSAKVRSGPPGEEDGEAKGFVGVVPIRTVADPAVAAAGSVGDAPHLSRMETLREAALPDAAAVLAEAFRWDAATVHLGAERLARYLRVQPDGWLAAYARPTRPHRPRWSAWAARWCSARRRTSGSSAWRRPTSARDSGARSPSASAGSARRRASGASCSTRRPQARPCTRSSGSPPTTRP